MAWLCKVWQTRGRWEGSINIFFYLFCLSRAFSGFAAYVLCSSSDPITRAFSAFGNLANRITGDGRNYILWLNKCHFLVAYLTLYAFCSVLGFFRIYLEISNAFFLFVVVVNGENLGVIWFLFHFVLFSLLSSACLYVTKFFFSLRFGEHECSFQEFIVWIMHFFFRSCAASYTPLI